MSRQTALWGLAALLGIVLTAGITWTTSQLTSQHIGISSEPISAGHSLAPLVAERSAPRRNRPGHVVTGRTVTAPRATATATAQSTPTAPQSTQVSPAQGTPTAPAAPVEATPPVAAKQTPAPQTPSSSGDDGGGQSRGGGGRSARGRDD